MCGIAGIWGGSGNEDEYRLNIKKMTTAIYHRGPDNYGYWNDFDEKLYLGHRRLSILDLSIAGHQPMASKEGRYVLSFNGEIYNHYDLKLEIEKLSKGINWIGHSDTEILLELITIYGLEKAISKCRGMFALALWDKSEKSLKLARDRMGEKPLYYGFSGSNEKVSFLFGSEISVIKAFKYFDNRINPQALSELINYQSISAPNTIYKEIHQLLPGHVLTINSPKKEFLNESKCWWDLTNEIKESMKSPIHSEKEAKLILENKLRESIRLQSIADVPLGTFLSGGIDSSLITALLQDQSSERIKTFTIGFEETEFNEAPFSKKIANFLNTDHNEIYLTSKDTQNLIPKLNSIFSEPFADMSQIPTYLVCREARNSGLKVTLSGDGGDELFGGYNRYFLGQYLWKRLEFIPWQIRKLIGNFFLNIPETTLNNYSEFFGVNQLGSKLHKLSNKLKYIKNSNEFYHSLISQWYDPSIIFGEEFKNKKFHSLPKSIQVEVPNKVDNLAFQMMFFDTLNYLPNDILTKVDRTSMASSLEVRAPFLDFEVCKVAWKINMELKVNSNYKKNTSKSILRKILFDYIPQELINRPKAGFGVPIAKWLRGPLRSWAGDLLSKENIRNYEYLQYEPIAKIWEDHLSSKYDNSLRLWPIIMWQSWLDNQK